MSFYIEIDFACNAIIFYVVLLQEILHVNKEFRYKDVLCC